MTTVDSDTRCSVWEYWARAIIARLCSVRQDLWLAPKAGHRKKWFAPSTYVESGRAVWTGPFRVVPPVLVAPARVAAPVPVGPVGPVAPVMTIGGRAQRVHFGDPSITAEIARFYDEEAANVAHQ